MREVGEWAVHHHRAPGGSQWVGPECQGQVGHLGKDASERNRVSIQNGLELAEGEGCREGGPGSKGCL